MTNFESLRAQFGINKKMASFLMAASILFNLGLSAAPAAMAVSQPTAKISFTFDDNLDSALTYAAPILKTAGYTGTDFVISGCVGMTTTPNTCHANNSAKYMTWAQINQLKNTYGWEIGSHTATHPYLASADATDGQPNILTPSQVDTELTTSQLSIGSNVGVTPTDFATPYGDWTPPVLAQIARVYGSHRGFADSIDQTGPAGVPDGVIDHGNTYPYNDYLLYDYQVQAGVTPAQVTSMITQTKASNQWLVLTFHDILPNASTNAADYQYSTADFQAVVDLVKASGVPVVNINNALVTNAANLLSNSSFDTAISSNIADTTVWSTDDPAHILQNTANNGNYPSPTNSVELNGTTKNVELFSPRVPVDASKKYVIKNYLDVAQITAGTNNEVAFYIDEYDASGAYLGTTARFMKAETSVWTESLNFEYAPTAGASFARLQVVATANSNVKAYLDNVQMFAEDGSTTGGQGGGTVPAPTPATGKAGDVNGDNLVNGLDLSIMLSHWNKTGVTRANGDLSGDGNINGLDLSILLSNWNK